MSEGIGWGGRAGCGWLGGEGREGQFCVKISMVEKTIVAQQDCVE
jgi:hypothetical protein